MENHLALAEAFAQELQQSQPAIVAILLTGSVARRQTAPFSDIDLLVITPEHADNQVDRSGSTWRDGIYFDVDFRPQNAFAQLDQVLSNPIAATALNDGMILYDPIGFLAALQAQVQTHFMEPRWVQARVQSVANRIQSRLDKLSAAIAVQDPLQICIHAGQVVFALALLPLIRNGFAPSSTRHLVQLTASAPELAMSIRALEGSSDMTDADVAQTYAIFAQLTTLGDTSRWGQLPIYMMRKVEWMIQHDLDYAAVHTMWNNVGYRINDCLATSGLVDQTQHLAQAWLHQTGWSGESTLAIKLQMAKRLFDQANLVPDA